MNRDIRWPTAEGAPSEVRGIGDLGPRLVNPLHVVDQLLDLHRARHRVDDRGLVPQRQVLDEARAAEADQRGVRAANTLPRTSRLAGFR